MSRGVDILFILVSIILAEFSTTMTFALKSPPDLFSSWYQPVRWRVEKDASTSPLKVRVQVTPENAALN